MMTMPLSYEEVRRAVVDYIRQHERGQVPHGFDVFRQLQAEGTRIDDSDRRLAKQVFHELYLERIIVSGSHKMNSLNALMEWPWYEVTEYGRRVLNNPEYEPHDQTGYLDRLRQEMPAIDADIVRYLDESLQCFKLGTLLAAAVMLGCAAEKAMLLLIDAYGSAIQDATKQKSFDKDVQTRMISRKYQALWKRLEPSISDLPADLRDDLHTVLDRVFDLIRTTRNEAGHPTGKSVDRDAMRANLLLFPSYCRRVYGLIDHWAKNPV